MTTKQTIITVIFCGITAYGSGAIAGTKLLPTQYAIQASDSVEVAERGSGRREQNVPVSVNGNAIDMQIPV